MPTNELRTTLAQAKADLRQIDIVITKRDGEYRVNFKGGKEETAYYTNDINDAVDTGKTMNETATNYFGPDGRVKEIR